LHDFNEDAINLTGIEAGERKEDGTYEENTVNARVEEQISKLANQMKGFGK